MGQTVSCLFTYVNCWFTVCKLSLWRRCNEVEFHPRQLIQRTEPSYWADDPDPATNIHPDTRLHDSESWHQHLQFRRVLGGEYVGVFLRYCGGRICLVFLPIGCLMAAFGGSTVNDTMPIEDDDFKLRRDEGYN